MVDPDAGLVKNLAELLRRKLVTGGETRKGGIDLVGADGLLNARDLGALQYLVDELLLGLDRKSVV